MTTIKTAGDLRGFLADILVGIRDGGIEVDEAKAIALVAGQITNSLAVEVNTAIQMQKMGKGDAVAGSMLIRTDSTAEAPEPALEDGGGLWCEQCQKRVTKRQRAACSNDFCKAK